MADFSPSAAIVIEKPRRIAFREIRLTPRRPESVIVRTTMSAISSGTDMKTWRGEHPPGVVQYPLVPGYENVGVVEEVGHRADTTLVPGDRVLIFECRRFGDVHSAWGGNSRHVVKDADTAGPNDQLEKIPDGVSDVQAVLAYLACVAHKGILRIPFPTGATVVVFGAGLVGICAMQIVKILHPDARVFCIERHAKRRAIARHYAREVIAADGTEVAAFTEATTGTGADVIIETTGNADVVSALPRFLKSGGWRPGEPGGHIHLQGDYARPIALENYHRWLTSNCTVTVSCFLYQESKATVLGWLRSGQFRTDVLPLEIRPVRQCAEAYAAADRAREDVFKVLFDWKQS